MPETTPLIKAALNLRVGAGFDVYKQSVIAISCKLIRVFYAILAKGVTYDAQKLISDIHRQPQAA